MNAITRKSSWPLLGKELVEQAARKRTYVVRVLYASLLLGISLIDLHLMTSHGQSMTGIGYGRFLFENILEFQCLGVLLFLPAMMAGVITSEKERGSLELLFLTDLKPWEIIWQKYLGRLIPMFTFLLVSLPLLAVAYAFGGVDTEKLIYGILMLFLTCLQLGAFSLMCSAYCRTTTGAVLAAYLLGALFYLFIPLLFSLFNANHKEWIIILNPPIDYLNGDSHCSPGAIIAALLTTGLFLLKAKSFLTRRAFATPKNILLRWFKKLDGFFKAKNQLIGGHVFFAKPDSLPDDQPVAWRELERRSLGQWNYLVRIFVVLEAATIFLFVLFWKGMNTHVFSLVLMILWVAATLALSVQAVNVVTTERTNQTLETLLTTPLMGRDILLQKMRGLYRLMFLFGIPMLTIFGVATLIAHTEHVRSRFITGATLSMIIYMIIYLPMIAWVSLWISLQCRKRNQAVLLMLGVLMLWCLGPPLVMVVLEPMNLNSAGKFIFLLSPADVAWVTLFNEWKNLSGRQYTTLAVILTFGFYIIVLYSARVACLRRADRYLRGEATPGK